MRTIVALWPLLAAITVLVTVAVVYAAGGVIHVIRKRKRRRVFVGAEAAAARVGQEIAVARGRHEERLRIVGVNARVGTVDVVQLPPSTAAGSDPKRVALLRALGFDPATHDLRPVEQPWRGVQVLCNGERVRFFTERQVRKLAGAWKTALRTVAA